MIRFVKGWNCLDSLEWRQQHQQQPQQQQQPPGDPGQQGEEDRGRSLSPSQSLAVRVITENTEVIMVIMEIPGITHSTVSTTTLGMEEETGTGRRDLERGALILRRRRMPS